MESQLHCICRLLRWQGMAIVQDGVDFAAHLNHYWEMVYREKQDHQKASLFMGKLHNIAQANCHTKSLNSCRSTEQCGCN